MHEMIRGRFLEALPRESWMASADRLAAEKKLKDMFFQVAWPSDSLGKTNWPMQATQLDGRVMEHSFLGNFILSKRVQVDGYFRDTVRQIDRMSWGDSSPLEVNAFYQSQQNGLFVAAAILQAPFFRHEAGSNARNFGAMGAILGHEMSHGFDATGRKYDERGELHDWWCEHTVTGYRERSKCFENLFDSYQIVGRHVKGEYTLNEDLADAGGITFAYAAFMHEEARNALDTRVFFTSFAQMYCDVQLKKPAIEHLLTDTHAPNKFRVLGALSQFKPFADAFQCPTGAPMAPLSRCELW